MSFFGEYIITIENGRIKLPWNVSAEGDMLWIMIKDAHKSFCSVKCMILSCEKYDSFNSSNDQLSDDYKVINKGDLYFAQDNMWEIPQAILDYLCGNEIILCGVGEFIEILSYDDKAKRDGLLPDALSLLNDL